MGKAARNKKQRTERTPKVPTHRYLTPKERQEERRRDRQIPEDSAALIEKLARLVREHKLEGGA